MFLRYLILILIFNIGCEADKEYIHGHEHKNEHYKDGIHDADFDHQVIAGSKEEADNMNKLSPEELKERFLALLTNMDTNGDGFISKEEIANWVLSYFRKEDLKESEERLQELDGDGDDNISWQEYVKEIYSYSLEDIEKFRLDTTPDMLSFIKMVDDDAKRFKLADVDKDGMLTIEEYAAFLHPENYEAMGEYEIDLRLEEMDKNKDGQINFEEFLGEGVTNEEQRIVDQENFNYYDRNFNNQLDRIELKPWVVPDQKSMAEEEADHLFDATNSDSDDKLSFDEVLAKKDLWIGSAATAYGTELRRRHDPSEL